MKQGFLVHKESFIQSRREDIQQFYQINPKELGKGAYGIVYKAKEKSGGEWRAIKKITKRSIKNPKILINEIEILKSLDHPLCIKLYETFEDQNNLFLVTDLCDGGQLFDRLDSEGNFSQEDGRKIFIQIMEALTYCHSHNIAHRDLKPENFLFLKKNSLSLKLIDFGLAYRWKTSMKEELIAKGERRLVGTSYYIAPEIIRGSYDERCDIWSAGVILYILLSAAPPFDGENDKEIMENVRKLNYSVNSITSYLFMVGSEMKAVSKEAKALIEKMLKPEGERIDYSSIFGDIWVQKEQSKSPPQGLLYKTNGLQQILKGNIQFIEQIKKLAASYIATQLSEKEVEQLGNLFRQVDLNHDGEISIQELKLALKEQGINSSLKDLATLMDSIDSDKNGKINYNQFLASQIEKRKLFTEEKIKSFFRLIDKDGNGTVDRSELVYLLKVKGDEVLNGKSVDQILNLCDKDGNGVIDYEEFKASILF